jgi:hypothetical protein
MPLCAQEPIRRAIFLAGEIDHALHAEVQSRATDRIVECAASPARRTRPLWKAAATRWCVT